MCASSPLRSGALDEVESRFGRAPPAVDGRSAGIVNNSCRPTTTPVLADHSIETTTDVVAVGVPRAVGFLVEDQGAVDDAPGHAQEHACPRGDNGSSSDTV